MNNFIVFYVGVRTGKQIYGRTDVEVDIDIDTMDKVCEIEEGIKEKFNFTSCVLTGWKELKKD